MENSYRYFENKQCKYYPCHQGLDDFNCLFCYCPLYHLEKCLGHPRFKEKDGKIIKICTDCNFPHNPKNYEAIVLKLKEK